MYVGVVTIAVFVVMCNKFALEWNMQIKGIGLAYSIYNFLTVVICQVVLRCMLREFDGVLSPTRRVF